MQNNHDVVRGRKPYWMIDPKRFKKCEMSGCRQTAEQDFGTCTMHRQIAFSESRGTYKGTRLTFRRKL